MGNKRRREIPRFGYPIIETHCHLDYLKGDELTDTLMQAKDVGVETFITIAVSPDNLDTVVDLTTIDNAVYGTQGIHPHEASGYNEDVARTIERNLQHDRILAVGEIGLDYYYEHSDRAAQRQAFRQQLKLAAKHDMPFVVHTRDADTDTAAILTEFSGRLRAGGVIHSFTSGLELAEFCIEEGYYLGFNGITTFNNAENVRDVVRATPIERILLETDSPYLTPVPYRGRRNAPCYLPFIAEKIAELKDMSVDDLLQQVYHNSKQLFFPDRLS